MGKQPQYWAGPLAQVPSVPVVAVVQSQPVWAVVLLPIELSALPIRWARYPAVAQMAEGALQRPGRSAASEFPSAAEAEVEE